MTYTDPEGTGVCLPPGVHAFSVWFPAGQKWQQNPSTHCLFQADKSCWGVKGTYVFWTLSSVLPATKTGAKAQRDFLGMGHTCQWGIHSGFFFCLLLTAGKELSVLCFEWMDLSCELPHQITHVHSTAVKKEFPYRVSLLGMCTLQSLRTEVLQETWTSPTSRTQGMSQQLRS